MKKPFKETKVFAFMMGGLRIADKFALGGNVFNVLDQNNTPSGQLDAQKSLRDFIVWIPFLVMAYMFVTGKIDVQTFLDSAPK